MVDQREQQLLVGGFSLGLLAGAIGFYLFGTKDGQRVRRRLSQEWDQAQDYFQEKQIFPEKEPQNLAEFLEQLKEKIMLELELEPDYFSGKQDSSHKKRRLPSKKTPPKKFVGT